MISELIDLEITERQVSMVQDLVQKDTVLATSIYRFPLQVGYSQLNDDALAYYSGIMPKHHREYLERVTNTRAQKLLRQDTQRWFYQILSWGEAFKMGHIPLFNVPHKQPLAYIAETEGIYEADPMAHRYGLTLDEHDVQDLRPLNGWTLLAMREPTTEQQNILALCVDAKQNKPDYPFEKWKYRIVVCWCPPQLRQCYGYPIALEYNPHQNYD